jgi:hypothetical protein
MKFLQEKFYHQTPSKETSQSLDSSLIRIQHNVNDLRFQRFLEQKLDLKPLYIGYYSERRASCPT